MARKSQGSRVSSRNTGSCRWENRESVEKKKIRMWGGGEGKGRVMLLPAADVPVIAWKSSIQWARKVYAAAAEK